MNQETNPFQPPQADIQPVDVGIGSGDLLEEPRRLSAGHGMQWIREGWTLFRHRPGLWILMLLTTGAIFVAVSLVPLLGILGGWLFPIFLGGWMVGCHRIQAEGELRFEDLFAGFSQNFGPLAIAGLIYLGASVVATIVAVVVIAVIGGSAAVLSAGDPGMAFMFAIAIGVLVAMALLVPVLMIIWFAPALIILHQLEPVDALKMSFFGCLRNFLPFLVYGLVGLLLLLAGTIPLLLGLLVAYPVLMCAIYPGYRDIFVRDERA